MYRYQWESEWGCQIKKIAHVEDGLRSRYALWFSFGICECVSQRQGSVSFEDFFFYKIKHIQLTIKLDLSHTRNEEASLHWDRSRLMIEDELSVFTSCCNASSIRSPSFVSEMKGCWESQKGAVAPVWTASNPWLNSPWKLISFAYGITGDASMIFCEHAKKPKH